MNFSQVGPVPAQGTETFYFVNEEPQTSLEGCSFRPPTVSVYDNRRRGTKARELQARHVDDGEVEDDLLSRLSHALQQWLSPKYKMQRSAADHLVMDVSAQPLTEHVAIARSDGAINIRRREEDAVFVLSDPEQRNVTSVAWCPTSSGQLVVGCSNCLILWSIDMSTATGAARILSRSNVRHLTWSPCGNYVAVAVRGRFMSGMEIWDMATLQAVTFLPLTRFSRLSWSPCGRFLLAATESSSFYVFNTTNWRSTQWTTGCGPLTASAWSHTGQHLVFTARDSYGLYCLQFESDLEQRISPIYDTTPHTVTDINGLPVSVGGQVVDMAWDPLSMRLVLVFEHQQQQHGCQHDAMDGSALAAFFVTRTVPGHVSLVFSGFVAGPANAIPQRVVFSSAIEAWDRPEWDAMLLMVYQKPDLAAELKKLPFVSSSRGVAGI